MDSYEIPLVIFTVLIQWSVGITLAIVLLEWFKPEFMKTVGKNKLKTAIYASLGMSVIGTLASIFHLGNPLKSYTSLIGTSHSWLSREIIMVIVFNLCLVIFTYIWWKMGDKDGLRKVVGTMTMIVGVVMVIISGMVYFSMPLHPVWNHWTTFANFLLTGIILGALTVTYFVLKGKTEESGSLMKFIGGYLAFILAALFITIGSSFVGSIDSGEVQRAASITMTSVLFWIRVFSSLLIPATLIIYFIVTKNVKILNFTLIATGIALIGELSGRMMFYHSVMSQYPWF